MSSEGSLYMDGLGNKISDSKFNLLKPDDKFIVLRGIFDSNGSITKRNILSSIPSCSFKSELVSLNTIKDICKVECKTFFSSSSILFEECNAIDFLSKLYDNSDARYRKKEFYDIYIDWVTFGLYTAVPSMKFAVVSDGAVIPFKSRASDIGYDLTIISLVKQLGKNTAMYDTGIKIKPDFGYYTQIVARSSLVKSGYIVTNSVGIIDPTYRGSLKIVLTKVDDSFPDLKLPYRCCQLIFTRTHHYTIEKVTDSEILNTDRGDGGFGSTNI